MRVTAGYPLVRFGPKARHAVPVLRKWLGNPNDDWMPSSPLGQSLGVAPEQVEEMVDVLIANIGNCPTSSVEKIGDLGPSGIGALPVLLDLLHHEWSGNRLAWQQRQSTRSLAIRPITCRLARNLLASDEWPTEWSVRKHWDSSERIAVRDAARSSSPDERQGCRGAFNSRESHRPDRSPTSDWQYLPLFLSSGDPTGRHGNFQPLQRRHVMPTPEVQSRSNRRHASRLEGSPGRRAKSC